MELTQGLHGHRRRRPHATALVFGDMRLSWDEFGKRVIRLAGALRFRGVKAGDRVAILAQNGPLYLEAIYATLWIGAIAMPVNSRYAFPEMIEQLNDAEPACLIAGDGFGNLVGTLRAALPGLATMVLDGSGALPPGVLGYEAILDEGHSAEDARCGGDSPACIFYTGGTTGRAKGVVLSHANIWANAVVTAATCGFDERLVHLHSGPLFHLGAASRVFTTTIVGGCHVLVPRFSPDAVLDAIGCAKVNVATFVPTMLAMILDRPDIDRFDLSSLRLVTYGASPMPAATLRRSLARFPNVSFVQSYGMTELSPVATMLTADDHSAEAPPARLRSAGRPVFSADVRVVAPNGDTLSAGAVGEVAVRGPMVMLGYWRQPELTRRAVRDGWMHTGDAGYFDADGYLFITDRMKDMIITGGENVYSLEVENVLGSHPAVQDCAVIGVPDEHWGERVHAVVVLVPGSKAEPDELLAYCRPLIAGYKCPRSMDISDVPLPLSNVSKVDKAALRRRFAMAGVA